GVAGRAFSDRVAGVGRAELRAVGRVDRAARRGQRAGTRREPAAGDGRPRGVRARARGRVRGGGGGRRAVPGRAVRGAAHGPPQRRGAIRRRGEARRPLLHRPRVDRVAAGPPRRAGQVLRRIRRLGRRPARVGAGTRLLADAARHRRPDLQGRRRPVVQAADDRHAQQVDRPQPDPRRPDVEL
ncbi:MAG: UPF0301 protein YqgE, partial [uncultured Phycisphaerae bacterium]